MKSVYLLSPRNIVRKSLLALFVVTAMAVGASAATVGPGGALDATFSLAPNTADMLWFFDNTALTETGAPVITAQLYDGSTLLGTISEPASPTYLSVGYESPASLFTLGGFNLTTINFASLNAGGSAFEIVVTVTGGTITFDPAEFNLYDAASQSSSSFKPLGDASNIAYNVVAPEPGTGVLVGLGLAACAAGLRRRR